ncbi:MAG: hypothetical protein JNK49_03445, partial [Planctomycetes bacterium]|nr:hypothetical protein [Planctomycetota bacterium]
HFVLRDASGHETALQLRAGTLLPERFGTGDAAVACVDYLRTSSTWMVARAASSSLGTVALTFEHAGLDWRPDFFAPPEPATAPASAPTPPPQSTQWSPSGGETRPAVPQLQELRGHSRVLLDDPGDWPRRAAAYLPVHQELERQDQTVFGFPMLLQQQGRSVLAVPFRPRNAARTFQAPAGWRIVAVPAGRQLVVFPPQGDFAARRQDGERLLHSALTAQALTATGELVCQPYLHLEDGPPTAAQLEALTVRMSVPVR